MGKTPKEPEVPPLTPAEQEEAAVEEALLDTGAETEGAEAEETAEGEQAELVLAEPITCAIPVDPATGEPYKCGEIPPGWNQPVP